MKESQKAHSVLLVRSPKQTRFHYR